MKAALYANGRLVTGANHGEAYEQLSEQEKQEITSGFIDEKTGHFICPDEGTEFYLKHILLIRHAHISDSIQEQDPHLTQLGHLQSQRVADFIAEHFNLADYCLLSSPSTRCVETMEHVSLGHDFSVDSKLGDGNHAEEYDQLLEGLPDHSLLVTHCHVAAYLAIHSAGLQEQLFNLLLSKLGYASITLVESRTVKPLSLV